MRGRLLAGSHWLCCRSPFFARRPQFSSRATLRSNQRKQLFGLKARASKLTTRESHSSYWDRTSSLAQLKGFPGRRTPDMILKATPVIVVRGVRPGPTLCLTAAVHGSEINGIRIVQRIIHSLKPDKLSGNVIAVPIVNLQGFRRKSRYLWDRRDLNRYFPGHPQGNAAARISSLVLPRHRDAMRRVS